MLFIDYRINTNKNTLPLAQALVPIKVIFQWTQFLGYLKSCFPRIDFENYTFILDQEKGITTAISKQFNQVIYLYYYQYIANNL